VIAVCVDGDAVAVRSRRTTATSFRELYARSAAVAAALHDGGVRRGDRVLIQLPNSVELIAAIQGCLRLGAIAVPVLPLFRVSESTAALRQTMPSAVIAAADLGGNRSPAAEVDERWKRYSVRPLLRLVVGSARTGWSAFPGPGTGEVASFGRFTDPGRMRRLICSPRHQAVRRGPARLRCPCSPEMNSYGVRRPDDESAEARHFPGARAGNADQPVRAEPTTNRRSGRTDNASSASSTSAAGDRLPPRSAAAMTADGMVVPQRGGALTHAEQRQHRDGDRTETPTALDRSDELDTVGQLDQHAVAAAHAAVVQGRRHCRRARVELRGTCGGRRRLRRRQRRRLRNGDHV